MQFDMDAPVPAFLGVDQFKEAAVPNFGQIAAGASNTWNKVRGFFGGAKTPPILPKSLPKAPTPTPMPAGSMGGAAGAASQPGLWGRTWNTTKSVGGTMGNAANIGMTGMMGYGTLRDMYGGQPGGQPGGQMGPMDALQAQQAMANGQMSGLPSDYYTGFMGGQNPGAQTNFMHEIMARGNAAKMQQPQQQSQRTVYIDTAAPMMSQAHASIPSFF